MFWETIASHAIAETTFKSLKDFSGTFIFNWFNLSECGEISLNTSNDDDVNSISVETYDSPRQDWWGILGYYVRGKIINISVVIQKDNEADLNDAIDEIKNKLFIQEWLLEIKKNGAYRSAKANLTSISFNRDYEKEDILANVEISFLTKENFQSEDNVSHTETGVTTNSLALDIQNDGIRCPYMLYIIFWSSVSGTDWITVEQEWYTLEIEQAISPNDILVIDGIEKRVLLNGDEVDYNWPFVLLKNGSNPVQVNINWAYTADITYLYRTNYL